MADGAGKPGRNSRLPKDGKRDKPQRSTALQMRMNECLAARDRLQGEIDMLKNTRDMVLKARDHLNNETTFLNNLVRATVTLTSGIPATSGSENPLGPSGGPGPTAANRILDLTRQVQETLRRHAEEMAAAKNSLKTTKK